MAPKRTTRTTTVVTGATFSGPVHVKGDLDVSIRTDGASVVGPARISHRVEVDGRIIGDFDYDTDDFGAFDPERHTDEG